MSTHLSCALSLFVETKSITSAESSLRAWILQIQTKGHFNEPQDCLFDMSSAWKLTSKWMKVDLYVCQLSKSELAWLLYGWANLNLFEVLVVCAWRITGASEQWESCPDCWVGTGRHHCCARSALRLAFIFSSLLVRWLLLASSSSIRSSADLNWKNKQTHQALVTLHSKK